MTERVLILCTANSARSQMAGGCCAHWPANATRCLALVHAPPWSTHSRSRPCTGAASTFAAAWSKALDVYLAAPFDYVITVRDNAAETCPMFLGRLAVSTGASRPGRRAGHRRRARLAAFETVRDAIEAQLRAWLAGDA